MTSHVYDVITGRCAGGEPVKSCACSRRFYFMTSELTDELEELEDNDWIDQRYTSLPADDDDDGDDDGDRRSSISSKDRQQRQQTHRTDQHEQPTDTHQPAQPDRQALATQQHIQEHVQRHVQPAGRGIGQGPEENIGQLETWRREDEDGDAEDDSDIESTLLDMSDNLTESLNDETVVVRLSDNINATAADTGTGQRVGLCEMSQRPRTTVTHQSSTADQTTNSADTIPQRRNNSSATQSATQPAQYATLTTPESTIDDQIQQQRCALPLTTEHQPMGDETGTGNRTDFHRKLIDEIEAEMAHNGYRTSGLRDESSSETKHFMNGNCAGRSSAHSGHVTASIADGEAGPLCDVEVSETRSDETEHFHHLQTFDDQRRQNQPTPAGIESIISLSPISRYRPFT